MNVYDNSLEKCLKIVIVLLLSIALFMKPVEVYAENDPGTKVYDENEIASDTDADDILLNPINMEPELETDYELDNESASTNNPFTDINSGQNFFEDVMWAYHAKPQIVSGVTATRFNPYSICNRAQVVTFLWRMRGCPEPKIKSSSFRDVNPNEFYYKAVLWAYEKGITSGRTANEFGVYDSCTRAQFVTFIWKESGSIMPKNVNNQFTDVPRGKSYTNAVLWTCENGITSGKSSSLFAPKNTINRAQVVMFLHRFYMCKNNYASKYNGVNYSSVYNYNFYLMNHKDVSKGLGTTDDRKILEHFVNYGMNEGRQGSSEFNVYAYAVRYEDLRKVYGLNYKSYYLHYLRNGKSEGRNGTGTTTKAQAQVSIINTLNQAAHQSYNEVLSDFRDAIRNYYDNTRFQNTAPIDNIILYNKWNVSLGQSELQYSSFKYTFYDINKDGVDELIIAIRWYDGSMYTTSYKPAFVFAFSSGKVITTSRQVKFFGDMSIYNNGYIVSTDEYDEGYYEQHFYHVSTNGITEEEYIKPVGSYGSNYNNMKYEYKNTSGSLTYFSISDGHTWMHNRYESMRSREVTGFSYVDLK